MTKLKLKKLSDNLLHNDGIVFTFLRSGASAQVCSWLDMLVSFGLFAFANLSPWLSTALGAFVGGVLNCIINYRFTFHSLGLEWRLVIVKFMFVWLGSMLFNSFGTQALYSLIAGWQWLYEAIGLGEDSIFLTARLLVSGIVSIGWNFLLQRNFVYKRSALDPYILQALGFLGVAGEGDKDFQ